MRLIKFKLENFRATSHCELQLAPRLNVFLGENGSGKTSLLDGMAIGLGEILAHLPKDTGITFRQQGDIHQKNNMLAPYARITLETTQGLTWDWQQKLNKSQKTKRLIPPAIGLKNLRAYLDHTVIQPWNDGLPFIAKAGEKAKAIVLDGCVFTDNELRCDGLFLWQGRSKKAAILIELKGAQHIPHAFKQLAHLRKSRPEYRQLIAKVANEPGGQSLEKAIVISNGLLNNPEHERLEREHGIPLTAIPPPQRRYPTCVTIYNSSGQDERCHY